MGYANFYWKYLVFHKKPWKSNAALFAIYFTHFMISNLSTLRTGIASTTDWLTETAPLFANAASQPVKYSPNNFLFINIFNVKTATGKRANASNLRKTQWKMRNHFSQYRVTSFKYHLRSTLTPKKPQLTCSNSWSVWCANACLSTFLSKIWDWLTNNTIRSNKKCAPALDAFEFIRMSVGERINLAK